MGRAAGVTLLAAAMSVLCATPLWAQQSADPTQILQSMAPAQRDALMQQMGGGGSGSVSPLTSLSSGGSNGNQVMVTRPGVSSDSPDVRDGLIHGGEMLLIDLLPLPEMPANGLSASSSVSSSASSLSGSAAPGSLSGTTATQGSMARNDQAMMMPNGTPPDIGQRRLLVPLTELEKDDQLKLFQRIMRHNPYELAPNGVLQLPGFAPISLAGLSPFEARERLALDPNLQSFAVQIQILKLQALDVKALKPFGYEMFRGSSSAFVPGTDLPVPDDYQLGAGDQMSVQLYGQVSRAYTFPVGRDGMLGLTGDLGPISVGGMSFGAARSHIESLVSKKMLGTKVHVSLSELRSARVLVMGDAEHPGTLVVSGLSTATNALFASGGVKSIGSLRNIEIKRDGVLLRKLDLYDVILNGDTTSDGRLQTGDVVLVPPVGPTVGIAGELRRPAIYELKNEKTVGAVLRLAGGATPEADLKHASLERIDTGKERRVVRLNLDSTEGQNFVVKAGDTIRIPHNAPAVNNGIALNGHVNHPGMFAYHEGVRLSDVIASRDDLKTNADSHYILVRRENAATGALSVFSADLEAALTYRGTAADLALMPRDRITVFDLGSPRDRIVSPLMDELQRQATPGAHAQLMDIQGSVNAPGKYPLERGMRIADALRAGGGLKDDAYALTAELTRYDTDGGKQRDAKVTTIDLAAVLRGDASANIELSPYDLLTIRQTPEWSRDEQVQLVGEVKFPGTYRIKRGESLASVIKRAGGLTSIAFPRGAIFLRADLKTREQENIDRTADRLQAQLASASLTAANADKNATTTVAVGQALVAQFRATKAVGRLVIDLPALLARGEGSDVDVTMKNMDRLVIPRETQEVTVLGEVQSPTSHLFRRGMTQSQAIALSGGYSERAYPKRTYVVRADGSVRVPHSTWVSLSDMAIQPGDTVVVPMDTERLPTLMEWQAVTSIIYNVAIAASSLKTFGIL